jgi:molybdenum cofactor cytidylyltransferase
MGRPKMILPWGQTTVLGQVLSTLEACGVHPIVVVTGGDQQLVEQVVASCPVQTVFNPSFEREEMILSLKVGLTQLPDTCQAVLVVLGDQPQMQPAVVQQVMDAFWAGGASIVVPSFHMRRGHPWLLARRLWPSVHALEAHETLRDFLNSSASQIQYLVVNTESVLSDLDTPDEYARQRPHS